MRRMEIFAEKRFHTDFGRTAAEQEAGQERAGWTKT